MHEEPASSGIELDALDEVQAALDRTWPIPVAVHLIDAGRSMRDRAERVAFERELCALVPGLRPAGLPDMRSAYDRQTLVMVSTGTNEGAALQIGRTLSALGPVGTAVSRVGDDARRLMRSAIDALSIARAAGDRHAILAVR